MTCEDPGRDYFGIENNRHEGLGLPKINEQKEKEASQDRERQAGRLRSGQAWRAVGMDLEFILRQWKATGRA